MIPKRIHQIFMGGPPDAQMLRWINTVRDVNSTWDYCLWTNSEAESALGLRMQALFDSMGNWASVSNFLRLVILYQFGGFYLDCDFEALKPLDSLLDYGAVAAEQDSGRICNAFMGSESEHPWIEWQLGHFRDFDPRDAASGVYLATAAPRDGLTIIPQHLVYPFLYDAPEDQRKPHPDSLLVHAWAGSWTKK